MITLLRVGGFDGNSVLQVADPSILPAGGSVPVGQLITITCSTGGAAIHYTDNMTTPTGASPTYSVPFALNVSNLVDVTKWVGAYQTASLTAPNIVTGATGSALGAISGTAFSAGDSATSIGSTSAITGLHGFTPGTTFTDFSLAMFMRGDGVSGTDKPAMYVGVPGSGEKYVLINTSTQQAQYAGGGSMSLGTFWVTDAVFRHYAITYTAGTGVLRCYRDGVLITSVTIGSLAGTAPSSIGLSLSTTKGFARDIVFTKEVLSADAIMGLAASYLPVPAGGLYAPLCSVTPSLWLGMWDLTTSSCLNDIVSGSTYLMADLTAAVGGNALLTYSIGAGLNGSGGLGETTTTTALTRTSGARPGGGSFATVSIAMWIRNTVAFSGSGGLGGGPYWRLAEAGGHGASYIICSLDGIETTAGVTNTFPNTISNDGLWHHYAWVISQTQALFYTDGALTYTMTLPAAGNYTVECLMLENRRVAAGLINFDRVALYGGALSANAIATLAAGVRPTFNGYLPEPQSTTIKAIGTKALYLDSAVVQETYTISAPYVALELLIDNDSINQMSIGFSASGGYGDRVWMAMYAYTTYTITGSLVTTVTDMTAALWINGTQTTANTVSNSLTVTCLKTGITGRLLAVIDMAAVFAVAKSLEPSLATMRIDGITSMPGSSTATRQISRLYQCSQSDGSDIGTPLWVDTQTTGIIGTFLHFKNMAWEPGQRLALPY